MNANNDELSIFYDALKAIEEYRSLHEFPDKRCIFLLHFPTKFCSIITLETLYNCFKKNLWLPLKIYFCYDFNERNFFYFYITFFRKQKQKQAKIISSWTWFSKRLLSFVVKWKPFVFIFNISRDEIFCFFYYNNDHKVNFIYELSIFNKLHDKHKLLENNRSKLVTGFYIEGYSIWFVL